MHEIVQFVARHGYWLVVVAVLGRQACLPIPANLILLAAGALARAGTLSLSGALGLAVMAFLLADLAWYEAGHRLGDRILHFVCGLSGDLGSCVQRATSVFARHGVRTLLVSKFVVGLDAVAAPLAGASATRLSNFLIFDALGATFWSAAYATLGYIFSDQLERVAVHLARLGAIVTMAALAALGFYIMRKAARWYRLMRQLRLARITPQELRDKLNARENILLVDLQGRLNHQKQPVAIPGAVRIDTRRLEQYRDVEISPSQEVVLYCDCPGEFTSARVALALRHKGVEHVRVLAGGLQAWRARGFPVTQEGMITRSHDLTGFRQVHNWNRDFDDSWVPLVLRHLQAFVSDQDRRFFG